MANSLGNRLAWPRDHHLEEQEEAEEEEELKGRVAKNTEDGLDRWGLSFSEDNLVDVGLPEERVAYQDHPEEGEQGLHLSDLQGFKYRRETDRGSPRSQDGEYQEHDGTQEDLSPVSYWQLQIGQHQRLSMTENEQDGASSGEPEKQGGAWEAGSDGVAYPELSYECQYGSECSGSPEALRDPLASYKHGKSYSFTSDGGEDFSDGSSVSPSPSRDPPNRTQLRTDAFEVQSFLGDSSEFPVEMEFSSPSDRSPGSHVLSSPEDSTRWTQNLLSRLSIEDLQNSPGIDAETFPESSCADNLGVPEGTVVKMASAGTSQTSQHYPSAMVKPKSGLLDTVGRKEMPRAMRQVGHLPPERVKKLKVDVPHGLPSKFSRQSRSPSPQKKPSSCEFGPGSQVTPGVSNASRYGRGQLNYPLPDLSKVEPRVRFPKDPDAYHPPRGKSPPARSKDSGRPQPVIFKSPAEIVREVLMSSGEGSPQKSLTPSDSVIPEEFKSPRQATELVQQLQEDYHKLLTKYAEAENTIDRLRLGAKVRLYADPPKPSQGVQMGTISQGFKVMTFSIPQMRVAEVAGRSGPAPDVTSSQGLSRQQVASSLPSSVAAGNPGADGSTSMENPFSGDHLTQVLAAQARKFQSQVESLEDLVRTGRLMPQEQQKAFSRLKKAQGTLEQTYLQAREECKQLQNHLEPAGTLGDFDPDRAVEGEIFRLEMHLEELKERIDQMSQPAAEESSSEEATSPDPWPARAADTQMRSPTPSIQAPIPAVRTPYPQAPIPKDSPSQVQVAVEVSSISDEAEEEEEEEEEEGLPEPLRHKQFQVEKGFDKLVDHYSSFKSLPEALSLEQLSLYNHNSSPDAVGSAGPKDSGTQDSHRRKVSENNETLCISSSQQPQARKPPELTSEKTVHVPSVQVEESVSRETAEKSRSSLAAPKTSSRRQQMQPLSRGSMASIAGSTASGRTARKSFQKKKVAVPEDLRIVSPETDSGFVGSEASRVSPLAQLPKHRSSRSSSHGMLGKLPQGMPDAFLQPASRRIESAAVEPPETDVSTRDIQPEGSIQRHSLHSGSSVQMGSPPRWTNSVASEMEPGTDSTHTDSEEEGQSRVSAYSARPDETRHSPGFSAASPSPARTSWHTLLDSRRDRDQAIVALKNEVSQLRQSLEETLHQPLGPPKRSSSPRTSRIPLPFQGSTRIPKSTSRMGKTSGKGSVGSHEPHLETKAEGWERRAPFPPNEVQVDLGPSESECSLSKPQERKPQETAASSRKKSQNQSTLEGPYTGKWYSFSTPLSQEPKVHRRPESCPHCQEVTSQSGKEPACDPTAWEPEDHPLPSSDAFRPTQHSTQRKMAPCPLCRNTKNHRSKIMHGVDHSRGTTSTQGHSEERKPRHPQPPQPRGLWYWALPSPAASIGYLPTVPLATYLPSSVIYCSPPAHTSAFSPVGVPVNISSGDQTTALRTLPSWPQPRGGLSCSLTLNVNEMEDLTWALNRAVEAAKGVKLTTKRMSRTLTSELGKARTLRGSCLF